MLNNIYNYALINGKIDKSVLCELCDQMDEGMRERFVNAVLGIVDIHDVEKEIPREMVDNYKRTRRFRSYNYLQNRVEYEYDKIETRWFRDEESAKKYEETGDARYGTYVYESKEDFGIKAEHMFTFNSECDLCEWGREW